MATYNPDLRTLLASSHDGGRQNEANLSYEEVSALLRYDGEHLIWRVNRRGKAQAGVVAGRVNSEGYIQVSINNVRFMAHRIIWLLVHWRWPTDQLDHIDGNRQDNRLANLREVSHQENGRNQKLTRRNTSSVVGVSWYEQRGKWRACIRANRKTIHLGCFYDFKDAVAARKAAEREYGYHPNHGLDDEMREVLYG